MNEERGNMSEEFLEQNKEALLEEMRQALSGLNGYVNEVLTTDINPETDGVYLRTIMIAMGHQLGYLSALYNQFTVINSGELPKQRPIGFGAMIQGDKE